MDIATRIDGRLARITLTRPEALNALTLEMCLEITAALDQVRDDGAVAAVLIEAAGERAFSAGADMRALYRAGRAGNHRVAQRFWQAEYRLNAQLAEYPKPVLALMQGFAMGGGVGLGCHVSHRVVAETTWLGMPECCIGGVPDVGATKLLTQAPGALGRYLALTGYRLDAADALYTGFADHYVPRDRWTELVAAVATTGDAGQVARFAEAPGPSRLQAARPEIDRCFAPGGLAEVIARLQVSAETLTRTALARIAKSSPLAMVAALELQARYSGGGIREALTLEHRFTFRCQQHADFLEGLRAIIVEKDLAPQWRHPRLSPPEPGTVDALLAPLGKDELNFDGPDRA
ncbi:enoyl-CoA hydratase/isomerase family protein [Roseivivax sp. CAU 1761]